MFYRFHLEFIHQPWSEFYIVDYYLKKSMLHLILHELSFTAHHFVLFSSWTLQTKVLIHDGPMFFIALLIDIDISTDTATIFVIQIYIAKITDIFRCNNYVDHYISKIQNINIRQQEQLISQLWIRDKLDNSSL